MAWEKEIHKVLVEIRGRLDDGIGWKEAVDGWKAVAEMYKDESVAEVIKYLDGCEEVQVQRKVDEAGVVVQLFCRARLYYEAPAVFARGENLGQAMQNAVDLLKMQHENEKAGYITDYLPGKENK